MLPSANVQGVDLTVDKPTRWRPLGEILLERRLINPLQLQVALAEQAQQGGRLGEILFGRGFVSAVELRDALAEQRGLDLRVEAPSDRRPPSEVSAHPLPLGRLLMRRGYIDEAQLDAALAEQSVGGKPLGRVLVDNGAISASALAAALAEQQGVPTTAQAIWEAAQIDSGPGQPLYEIRESVGSIAGPLYVGSSLLDTTDVAFAVLQELDPQRLLVVQTERGRDVHVVWQYPSAPSPDHCATG